MNLVDLIKGQLSGDTLSQISSLLGTGEAEAEKATSAAVPALLSLVQKQVTKPGGADVFSDILKKTDFDDILKGGPASASKKGGDLLGSLLGGGALAVVIPALVKMLGLNADTLKKLLGFLLPMILKVVAGQLKGGISPRGLTDLFRDQEANIKAALPAGLSLADLPSTAPEGGLPGWLLPVAALALLGLAGWYFLGGPAAEPAPDVAVPVANNPPAPAVDAPPAPAPAPAANADLPDPSVFVKDLGGVFTNTTSALSLVKDPASADAALPKLEEANVTLDRLKDLWGKMNADGRKVIVITATEGLDKLKELTTKVLAIPGLGDKIKELIQAILTKLAGFATA